MVFAHSATAGRHRACGVLQAPQALRPRPVIPITGHAPATCDRGDDGGGYEYLVKPLELDRCARSSRAVRSSLDCVVRLPCRRSIRVGAVGDQLIVRCPGMHEVVTRRSGRVAGQTGDGACAARAHGQGVYRPGGLPAQPRVGQAVPVRSLRGDIPEVAVGMGSELFRPRARRVHRGPTAADRQVRSQCHGGTVFLDESAKMSPLLSAKCGGLSRSGPSSGSGGTETRCGRPFGASPRRTPTWRRWWRRASSAGCCISWAESCSRSSAPVARAGRLTAAVDRVTT